MGQDRVIKHALDTQVGGCHYKNMPIQPVEYIHRNGIGFCEGAAIKYLSRWRHKGGIEDLRKAIHFIEMLIEMEAASDQSVDAASNLPHGCVIGEPMTLERSTEAFSRNVAYLKTLPETALNEDDIREPA